MTHVELKVRREKGLCYNYDDKYAPSHKCKSKFFLLIGDDELQNSVLWEEISVGEDTTNSSISFVLEVIMHAQSGQISLRTIRVTGRIGDHYVNVLIDNGSTHNFIQEMVAHQLGLSITPSKQFRVYIGNGDFLICDNSCAEVKLCL